MFEGPFLKLKRANQHIVNFNEVVNAFLKTDFYSLFIDKDAHPGKYFLKFKMTKAAPPDLPVILGDAIHNLRASLDAAYCDCLKAFREQPTPYSRLFFEADRKKLVDKLNSGPMKAAPTIIDFIADGIGPYTTADNPLFGLHQLDIIDKHEIVLPVFSVTTLLNVTANCFDGEKLAGRIERVGFSVAENEELTAIGLPNGRLEFENNGNPIFRISFGKGHPFQGEPIVETLTSLSKFISVILQALAKLCEDGRRPV